MIVLPEAWKLVAAAGLAALIFASVLARAPRRRGPASTTRQLVWASLGLYAIGSAGWVTGHLRIAAILFGMGIGTAALGAWLSRAGDEHRRVTAGSAETPGDPPPVPPFDWEAFERDLLTYVQEREGAASGR